MASVAFLDEDWPNALFEKFIAVRLRREDGNRIQGDKQRQADRA
jgi:hypothetical protein